MATRHKAEIIATMTEIKWYIEGNKYYLSGPYKTEPRTDENLERAWKDYERLRERLRRPENR